MAGVKFGVGPADWTGPLDGDGIGKRLDKKRFSCFGHLASPDMGAMDGVAVTIKVGGIATLANLPVAKAMPSLQTDCTASNPNSSIMARKSLRSMF